MTLTITPKKTVAAALFVAPLALVACGSDEEDVVSGMATETNLVTVSADTPAPSTEKKDDKDKETSEEKKPEENEPQGAAQNQSPQAQGVPNEGAAGVVNPFEDGTVPVAEVEPIQGQAGNEADIKGMTETMHNIYNPKDVVSWSRVILDNSCKQVVDQTKQELASRGTSIEQTEREVQQAMDAYRAAGRPLPPVPQTAVSLNDVRVNGDIASASVTVSTNGQSDTAVQRFKREGDHWKVCN